MRRPSFNGSAFVVATAMMAFASSAEAQRATGPFSGILGAVGDPEASQSLDVRGSLFGSWDDTLSRTEGEQPVDEQYLRSGGAAGASGSLTHARRSSRLTWQSSATSSVRVYGGGRNSTGATFGAQSGLSTTLSRRVSLTFNGGWTYSPYYDFAPGLDDRLSNVGAFGGGFGVATAAERNTSATAGAGLSVQFSRRDKFEVLGSARRFDFLDQPDDAIDTWAMGARFRHTLTRSLGVHAGYGREDAAYRTLGSASATSDSIDVGVDYGDTLAFTRRTALSFGTSTSAVRWSGDTHYRINGFAALTRAIGRSGSGSLRYDRATEFNAGFRQPLLSDTVAGGVSNQLGRRASWSLQAGYVHSGIGFGPDARSYSSTRAGGGLNVAVTRRMSVFTDYSVYRYSVPAGATVFTSLPKFSRHSVTAGLSLWAPLISDKRSPRDSR